MDDDEEYHKGKQDTPFTTFKDVLDLNVPMSWRTAVLF